VATSSPVPSRPIGRTDGPDRANHRLFSEKPSNFIEINPQSSLISQIFFQKTPRILPKSTRNPYRFMGRPAFRSMGRPTFRLGLGLGRVA
jgi:hypothetical protein